MDAHDVRDGVTNSDRLAYRGHGKLLTPSMGILVTVGHSVTLPEEPAMTAKCGVASAIEPPTDLDVSTCSFELLLAIQGQMPAERFEQIKIERPDFAEWLNRLRAKK